MGEGGVLFWPAHSESAESRGGNREGGDQGTVLLSSRPRVGWKSQGRRCNPGG